MAANNLDISQLINDIDGLFNEPVNRKTLARWQRKASTTSNSSSPSQRHHAPSPRRFGRSQRKKSTPVSYSPSPRKIRSQRKNSTPVSYSPSPRKTSSPLRYARINTPSSRMKKSPLRKISPTDRFIPKRSSLDDDLILHNFSYKENSSPSDVQEGQVQFKQRLAQTLFNNDLNSNILSFKTKPPKMVEGNGLSLRVLYTQNKLAKQVKRVHRHISGTPERILDAPELLDDFYLNLVDWSVNNVLAVALGTSVYLWDACTGMIDLLYDTDVGYIASLSWMQNGSHLAVGMSNGDVQIWDAEQATQIRCMKGHLSRVGALAWNNHVLSSGSRDSMIFHHDVRQEKHHLWTSNGHQEEICGLQWSPDGSQLASGGNDNLCCIWNANSTIPLFTFKESAAGVKALAWCPWEKNVLATGGGTADMHIRFYNTHSGTMLNSINTESQVCSLTWGKHEKEILSSHGFSQNQLTLWKYPSMVKVTELNGHTSRVLHTSASPDGSTVCSAAADETLRFWKIWDVPAKKKRNNQFKTINSLLARSIR